LGLSRVMSDEIEISFAHQLKYSVSRAIEPTASHKTRDRDSNVHGRSVELGMARKVLGLLVTISGPIYETVLLSLRSAERRRSLRRTKVIALLKLTRLTLARVI
jgi:hypothetical protein